MKNDRSVACRRTLKSTCGSLLAGSLLALSVSCTANQVTATGGNSSGTVQTDSACAHSDCVTGTKLKSGCNSCVTKICDSDSYCCKTKWDSECVGEVATICDESCSGNPDLSQGNPDLSHGNPDLSHGSPDLSQGNPDLSSGGGSVGSGGGTVPSLYFAVVGDTRPPNEDDVSGYPTAIITKIYQDIEAMNPRPQFIVATGDYQYSSTTGSDAAPQLALYMQARAAYSGTVFAAMGNHECDGYTADNCSSPTKNYTAFANTLLAAVGQTNPYYSIPVNATDGSWTSKIIILACNYWSSTQLSWLQSELAKSTTYTFVVDHIPNYDTTGPCVSDLASALSGANYNINLTGHTHTYETSGKQVVVGTGGAPLSGSVYGYATVQQTSAGFVVTNYDYSTGAAVTSTTIPF